MEPVYSLETLKSMLKGPDLGKKSDEAGISAAKRPGGAGGEAGRKFLDEAEFWRKIFPPRERSYLNTLQNRK